MQIIERAIDYNLKILKKNAKLRAQKVDFVCLRFFFVNRINEINFSLFERLNSRKIFSFPIFLCKKVFLFLYSTLGEKSLPNCQRNPQKKNKKTRIEELRNS